MDKFITKKNIPKPTNFGKNLRYLRRISGLSQTKLAEALGLTRNNIASYESGTVEPNTHNFLKACMYLDVDPRKMLESTLVDAASEYESQPNQHSIVHTYVLDQLRSLIHQTNEMTKILEGYKAFFALRKSREATHAEKDLHNTLEDLLTLLEDLLKSNWAMISAVHHGGEEE